MTRGKGSPFLRAPLCVQTGVGGRVGTRSLPGGVRSNLGPEYSNLTSVHGFWLGKNSEPRPKLEEDIYLVNHRGRRSPGFYDIGKQQSMFL